MYRFKYSLINYIDSPPLREKFNINKITCTIIILTEFYTLYYNNIIIYNTIWQNTVSNTVL